MGPPVSFDVSETSLSAYFAGRSSYNAKSAGKEQLIAALNASTFKADIMPYGPTKFVNGQNEGARPEVMQAIKGDIGILRGNGFQTLQRVYWNNKATAITADVPSEAELTPKLWGKWKVQ